MFRTAAMRCPRICWRQRALEVMEVRAAGEAAFHQMAAPGAIGVRLG